MEKILVLGASVLQLPAIKKAKELGYYVGVVDMNPNAVGFKYADRIFIVSTIDVEGVINVAGEFKPNGVLTLATDMPLRSVAAVANKFNLPGLSPQVAIKATDKIAMIECFDRQGVPHPWFYAVNSYEEFETILKKINPPFIIKPNDASGSRGVVLINNLDEAISGFDYSKSVSKSGFVLIEEYLKGPEVSVEVITIEGRSHVITITDKLTTGSPYFVEMGHAQPSLLPVDIQEQIKNVAICAIDAIGINNSPSHVEIIVTEEGPKLVEVGARLGGDCITSHLVPFSTGVDMIKAVIDLATGKKPDISIKYHKGAAIRYINGNEGFLEGVEGLGEVRKIEEVKHIEIVKNMGDLIQPIHGSGDRIGYVITQADNVDMAVSICEDAVKSLKVLMKS